MKHILIIGSRHYPHLEEVDAYVAQLPLDVEVVSGGAVGVDTRAVEAAKARGMATRVFPPRKRPGVSYNQELWLRTREAVSYSDVVVAFQWRRSTGTENTLELARNLRKVVQLHSIEE